jgi:hypothetical protein
MKSQKLSLNIQLSSMPFVIVIEEGNQVILGSVHPCISCRTNALMLDSSKDDTIVEEVRYPLKGVFITPIIDDDDLVRRPHRCQRASQRSSQQDRPIAGWYDDRNPWQLLGLT